jgi:Cdc6-like AAA superfamily ATPase
VPDLQRIQQLAQSFSPSAPIDQQALFAGRLGQLTEVLNAMMQKGQHAILIGERGVGKTSLSRVLSKVRVNNEPLRCATINCDATTTFSSLWHNIAREINVSIVTNGTGFTSTPTVNTGNLAGHLPQIVTPNDVRYLLTRIGKILIIIDELDKLTDPLVTAQLSDTIKTLSDHAVDATLLLVGVADSVDVLISEHQSIERALKQVLMPRMSIPELGDIINKGLLNASMTINDEAKSKITELSQGLPHYTHLLALNAAQRVAFTERTEIKIEDVKVAIDSALSGAQQSTISMYTKAIASPRDNIYAQVLLACSLAKVDKLGYFAASDVRIPLSSIMKKNYQIPAFSKHLAAFCSPARGPVLQRTGAARGYRFRFVNPLMQPFITMQGIREGLITDPIFRR